MSIRKLFSAAIVGAAVVTSGVASAGASSSGSACVLREHRVTAVSPYKVTELTGRGSIQRLRGAEVFVLAEPGMSAEWLELTLGRHILLMQDTSMPDCVLDALDVRVEVDSAGAGYSVKLIATDLGDAKEVLQRARWLLG